MAALADGSAPRHRYEGTATQRCPSDSVRLARRRVLVVAPSWWWCRAAHPSRIHVQTMVHLHVDPSRASSSPPADDVELPVVKLRSVRRRHHRLTAALAF